ncbi:HAD family hydrolase [Streptomyces paromomycinus]|uniref:Hydrolase n=1 Tax=Streptomyces paromomycinus TaxID=92743 RepID=A0A401WDY1_STREY|nr:HAD family phosphatase [Streptomyces paromomycinus]GCD47564.1 hydrolase [Streptomyces paromomycinus]
MPMATTPDSPAAVIFDLDGTLVDSQSAYLAAEQQALAHFGYHHFTAADHAEFVGVGMREMWQRVVATRRVAAGADELLELSNRLYLAGMRRSVPLHRGTVHLAELLHEAGVPLAVASGSSRQVIDTVLTAGRLDRLFSVCVSAEDVPRGKPDPAVFLEAARRLSVPADACVVVEDATAGVVAALRAGMRCIAVTGAAARGCPQAVRSGRLLTVEHTDFDAPELLRRIGAAKTVTAPRARKTPG